MDNRRTCLLDCMLRNGGLTVHFAAPAVRVIEPVPGPAPPLIHVRQTRVVAPVPDGIGTTSSPTVYLGGDSGLKESLGIHRPWRTKLNIYNIHVHATFARCIQGKMCDHNL